MSQGPYFQGQPQSFDSQNATRGSVAYSSGGLPVSGQSQNAAVGSIQYPSGGQPVPGGMAVPTSASVAFHNGVATGAASSTLREYRQPQIPVQSQQQSQQRLVGVPPDMTRESNWSFRDSFGQKRNKCCTIS